VFAKNASYIKAKDGTIIFKDPAFTGASCVDRSNNTIKDQRMIDNTVDNFFSQGLL